MSAGSEGTPPVPLAAGGGVAVSVVIPTLCRDDAKLQRVLDRVLACEAPASGSVEIIVVDDGSPVPVGAILASRASPRFPLRAFRQSNAGPAAARNAGFRQAAGVLVLFLDDDVELEPRALVHHQVAHERHPGSVVFGQCLLSGDSPLRRFLDRSWGTPGTEERYVASEVVASGQLSVERAAFEKAGGVYRDDLATPAAEEFELAFRLRALGIPILFATHIVARHDTDLSIGGVCRQQYKHGVGCGEVARKCPEAASLDPLRTIIALDGPLAAHDPLGLKLRKVVKSVLGLWPIRAGLRALASLLERAVPLDGLLRPVYRLAIGAHIFAGVRRGLRTFRASVPPGASP